MKDETERKREKQLSKDMKKMEKRLRALKNQPNKEAGLLIGFLMRLTPFERALILSDSFYETEMVKIYLRLEDESIILADNFRNRIEELLEKYNYMVGEIFRYVLLKMNEGPNAYEEDKK